MGLSVLLAVLMSLQALILPLVVFLAVVAGCWWVQDRVKVRLDDDCLEVRNLFSIHTFELDRQLTVSLHKRRLIVQAGDDAPVTATAVDLNHDFKRIPSRGKARVEAFLRVLDERGVTVLGL